MTLSNTLHRIFSGKRGRAEETPPAQPAPATPDVAPDKADVAAKAVAPAMPQATPDEFKTKVFYARCRDFSKCGAMFSLDGTAHETHGTDPEIDWGKLGPDLSEEFAAWQQRASETLGDRQLIVLRSAGSDHLSLALLLTENSFASIVLTNSEIGRVLALSDPVLGGKED